ncbi:hypothetical protein [Pseudoxanthomonas sp.]|uniref:hypothetical protein n=1 Tax=Pseudoxanthomonas sp. TaxID=1871049 RepID=UPI0026374EA2|nr:hypothetical protein [Pseudoxanthomonas sp.]WDS35080.1 MAG: hypothetical protein O8I58_11950 [Pseudoxanthomonas sp.]
MNAATVLSLLLLATPLTALAQTDPLDLKLKDSTSFSGDGDPPGTYYGDHSGPAPADKDKPRSELDDGKAHLHGSFTTGMGYSKGYGSSTYNAADINISKAFTSDSGRTSVMSMDIHVSKSDGPGYGYGGYRGYGYGPRSASGASFSWAQDAASE